MTDQTAKPHEAESEENLPGINVVKVLSRINGNRSLLKTILTEFREQNLSTVDDIRQSIQRHDQNNTLFKVHALKGLAGNIGAETLAATVMELENAVRGEQKTKILSLLDVLEKQMDEVFRSALLMVALVETPFGLSDKLAPVHKLDIEQSINDLYDLICKNKVEATDRFMQLKVLFPEGIDRDSLESRIADYDFIGAKGLLCRLAESIGVSMRSDKETTP